MTAKDAIEKYNISNEELTLIRAWRNKTIRDTNRSDKTFCRALELFLGLSDEELRVLVKEIPQCEI